MKKKISHDYVVKLHKVLDVEGKDSLYMVMEYFPSGSLIQLVQSHQVHHSHDHPQIGLEIDLARKYFCQLIIGIDYLHCNHIIHYDIKPDNILLSSDKKQIKVVDFGVSAMFTKSGDEALVSRTIGSPAFLSPELIKSQPASGTAADIWAMGVTLYFMLTGNLPFPTDQIMEMYEAIESKAPPIPDEWDASLVGLMSDLLDKNPETRINMSDLKRHPWVTQFGKLSIPSAPSGCQSNQRQESSSDQTQSERMNNPWNLTDRELRESFKFGITNQCPTTKPIFLEILETSLKSCWKAHQSQICRRKELFFKEFHHQLSQRTKMCSSSS